MEERSRAFLTSKVSRLEDSQTRLELLNRQLRIAMPRDWSAFEFAFTLDMSGLLPHITTIEACNAATSLQVLPPQWRETSTEAAEADLRKSLAAHKDTLENEIRIRKLALVLANSGKAHRWVRERFAPGNAPMCLDDILHMHRILSEETGIRSNTAGVMRKKGRQVITGSEDIGFHQGAPASGVPRLMQQFIRFINGKNLASLPAIMHALVGHFFLTIVHPFEDGNGRLSRLVSAGILFQRGYNGHGFYALSNFFYENEERYHRILFQQSQAPCPDLTEFVAFGMEGLASELHGINSFIKIKLNRIVDRELQPSRKRRARYRTLARG